MIISNGIHDNEIYSPAFLSPFSPLPYDIDDWYSKNRIVRCFPRGELNCIFCMFAFLNSHHIIKRPMEKMRNFILSHSIIASALDIRNCEPHKLEICKYRNYIENHYRKMYLLCILSPVNIMLSTSSHMCF